MGSQAEISPQTAKDLARYVELLREIDRREAQQLLEHVFPDETHEWRGETYYARNLYPRHMEFFEAQATFREIGAIAANRTGKSYGLGGYSVALHLTGRYPKWWPGRRFSKPIRAWAAGKTNETTRDIVQPILLGEVLGSGANKRLSGTGLVPGDALGTSTWRQGVADLVDTVRVRHVSGGWSLLGLKSYQQGRGAFEGTAQHLVWLDEEPPMDVYGEALTRTMTTAGLLLCTFTPLAGMSDVVLSYLPSDGSV